MAHLMLKFLGSFEATLDGRPMHGFQSNKVRALLAYLAVENDFAHSRDHLGALFWPDSAQKRARANLSQAVYNLRNLLGEGDVRNPLANTRLSGDSFLLVDRETIQMNPKADIWIDMLAFNQLIQACKLHAHVGSSYCEDCTPRLEEAAELYGGDFLGGLHLKNCLAFEEWARIEQERLKQMAIQALHELAECQLQRGAFDPAQGLARRQLEIDPYQESAHRQLMRLLALYGQRNAALAHYDGCCQLLELELGVPPERETVVLFERIRDEEGLSPEKAEPSNNLPAFLVPLVGRKKELQELRGRLLDPYCRLLTVVGPGGSGKTRLVIDVARRLVGRFVHGIHFIPLSAVDSVHTLTANLAKTLGLIIHEQRPPKDQLLDYLRQKDMLLLMDSFESILDGTTLVAEILQTAPGLKILASSRVRLNIQGEQFFPLDGLDFKPAKHIEEAISSDSVQLFLTGARRVQPSFEITANNQTDVAEICDLLQGIPLAILLADAWVETLSPGEILEEIRSSYAFLETDWADVPEHQRSLRTTFDYSWRFLNAREQAIFQMLSIFRGGFTRQAAEYVSAVSPQELRVLIGKSFLGRATSGRYNIHDMLRQYGTEKLEGSPGYHQNHKQHSDYYLDLLAEGEPGLKSTRQQTVLNELDLELANIRAAWEWAVDQGDVARLGTTVNSLSLFYEMRVLYQEGERTCHLAVEMIETKQPSADRNRNLVKVKTWLARFHRLLGRPDLAQSLHQDCLNHLDDAEEVSAERAFLLLEMGNTVLLTDLEAAGHRYHKSLDLYHTIDDDWGAANALVGMAETALQSGRFAEAISSFEDSLVSFRKLGDPRGTATALVGIGGGLFRAGQLREGENRIRETIELFQELDDRVGIVRSQLNLARAFIFQGRYTEVIELYELCIPILKDLGLLYESAYFLAVSILSNAHMRRYEEVKLQAEEQLNLCQETENQRMLVVAYSGPGLVAIANEDYRLACDQFHKFVDILEDLGQPDERASGAGILGGAYTKFGDLPHANKYLVEALHVIAELRVFWAASWALPWVALYLAERGDIERAIEVYAMAKKLPIVANSPLYAEVIEKDIITASTDLPPAVVAAAQERGKAADLFATAAELLEDFKE